MAKFETTFKCDFDALLEKITDGVINASISATLEDTSDFIGASSRCSVRVFERYSYLGENRVSMNVTLFQNSDGLIHLSAITSGGSRATFFKINTFGEESFLDTLRDIL